MFSLLAYSIHYLFTHLINMLIPPLLFLLSLAFSPQNVPVFTSVVVVGSVVVLAGLALAALVVAQWRGRASETRARVRTLSVPGLSGPWIWPDLDDEPADDADRQQPLPDTPQSPPQIQPHPSKLPQPATTPQISQSQSQSSSLMTPELPQAYLVRERVRYTNDQ